jgi:hypothetical protein
MAVTLVTKNVPDKYQAATAATANSWRTSGAECTVPFDHGECTVPFDSGIDAEPMAYHLRFAVQPLPYPPNSSSIIMINKQN